MFQPLAKELKPNLLHAEGVESLNRGSRWPHSLDEVLVEISLSCCFRSPSAGVAGLGAPPLVVNSSCFVRALTTYTANSNAAYVLVASIDGLMSERSRLRVSLWREHHKRLN